MLLVGGIIILIVLGFFIFTMSKDEKSKAEVVVLETNKGEIKLNFFPEDAPKTVENFLKLAEVGFYDGLTFHRVIPDFMIQGGDPHGDGTGGPGYTFADEIKPESSLYQRGYVTGVLAMANSGPNTNGSQFFIMLKDTPLPPSYTIFGEVLEGQDVVSLIGAVQTDSNDKPLESVIIERAVVKSSE